jgi:hypothetical protein
VIEFIRNLFMTDFVLVVCTLKVKMRNECVELGYVNLLQKELKSFPILCILDQLII